MQDCRISAIGWVKDTQKLGRARIRACKRAKSDRGMHTSHRHDHRLPLAEIRPDLGRMGSNDPDICYVVAFLKRRDCIDVQDDTGDGSADLEYDFAEIIGDKADF